MLNTSGLKTAGLKTSGFRKWLVFPVLLVMLMGFAGADEGMWMPHQIKQLDLKSRGLNIDPADIYKEDGSGLINAIVKLRGATGEFVSSEGLILTNHHVAFGIIQRASDKENDYLANGFLSASRAAEIPAKGFYADVLLGYEDITASILKKIKPGMPTDKRHEAIDRLTKKIIARAEKKSPDMWCVVKAMYSGNRYYLFKYKRLRDVRLVYAPPSSLGDFGGEIDNWMWPRHTCDFTFLRAYVSKNNVGTTYSPDNVPFRPAAFLKISLDGVKENDFTFSMGYPGSTDRNYTEAELMAEIEFMKERITSYKTITAFLEEAIEKDRGLQIKYASKLYGIHNGLKNRTAKLDGFTKQAVPEKKRAYDDRLTAWINETPERKARYGNIVDQIAAHVKKSDETYRKSLWFSYLVDDNRGSMLLGLAHLITRIAQEKQKPDMKRDPDFQEREMPTLKSDLKIAERSYDPGVDRAYLKMIFKKILLRDPSICPEVLRPVIQKSPAEMDQYVDRLFAGTALTSPEKRLEFINKKPAELLALGDPLLGLAAELEKELSQLRKQETQLERERKDLKKTYMAALLEMFDGRIAPDANSTIRFTWGPVKSYSPRDAVIYNAQTTLKGVIEKDTGTDPFLVPPKIKSLYHAADYGPYRDKALDGLATCFLNTVNVTGGSSGSPVLNGSGELIGIVFDMVFESVIGDYFIIPSLQRVISVDIRYVLFVVDKFSGADHLINELTFKK